MDVRLLICWHPGNVFQASVIAVDLGKGWHKFYQSKEACATELYDIGLLTIMEQEEMLGSKFDWTAKSILNRTNVEREVLLEAGFVETARAKPN